MSIGKKVRFEVFKRDSFQCQYCGEKAPDVVLHVDHIKPKAEGGSDDVINLVTSCAPCNLGKGARELYDASVVEKQRRQMEELEQRRQQLEMMVEWQRSLISFDEDGAEQVAELWRDLTDERFHLNEKGKKGLGKLIREFGAADVMEAMRIAAEQYFRYEDDEPTQESVEYAWQKVGGICYNRKRWDEDPIAGAVAQAFYVFRDEYRAECSHHPPDWELKRHWDVHLASFIDTYLRQNPETEPVWFSQTTAKEAVRAAVDEYFSGSYSSYWNALQETAREVSE